MNMKENSAYIKGLLEGVNLDKTTPEGKVIAALCDMIDKMADEIDALTDKLDTASAYIEELDQDLGCVEELVYEDLACDCGCDDDDCDCCDCDCDDDDCDCGCGCDCCCGDEDEDYEEEDDGFLCVMCPNCGDTIYIEDTVDPADVVCPACQQPIVSDEDELEEI